MEQSGGAGGPSESQGPADVADLDPAEELAELDADEARLLWTAADVPGAPGQVYLGEDELDAAVAALRAVGFSELQWTVFNRWLFRKRMGLSATTPATFTSVDCNVFARDFFGTDAADGVKFKYMNPFASDNIDNVFFGDKVRPSDGKITSHWHMMSFFSRTNQMNAPEKKLYAPPIDEDIPKAEKAGREKKRRKQGLLHPPDYIATLQEGIGAKRVPLSALARWRYRFRPLPADTTVEDLIEMFCSEFHLAEPERLAVLELAPHSLEELVKLAQPASDPAEVEASVPVSSDEAEVQPEGPGA